MDSIRPERKKSSADLSARRRRGDGRPTIADVAARAGVAAITVSRALSDPSLVSDTLRKTIEEAVQALGYVPNLSARTLASTRSSVVGVLIPSLSQTVFTDVLRGVYDGVDGSPLTVQIGNTRYDEAEEERLIKVFLREKPAGMIVSGIDQTPEARRMLENAGCPVIQIMDISDDPIDQIIGFSHYDGGRKVTEHLIEEGYRRIGFIAGWVSRRSSGRLDGYRAALAAAGLPQPSLEHSFSPGYMPKLADASETPAGRPVLEFATPRVGRELFRAAIAADPGLDAVFCNNDILALGVLFECQAQGIRVPEDMGIAGFNDHDYMESAFPSLSSGRTHRYRNGLDAVVAIRRRLGGAPVGEPVIDMGVEVMKRRSTDRSGNRRD
ncbi:transcriptional regulator, LacI family [Kaistia soli DSM 19436]|uniref:Transcriptional regulator, LacI family n=1 Tax=Kaistia soli DSM 19436 TaxID=1122133 RepID=A0A1M5GDH4_9HYPH|nr:LacI family DNA-binding transcriptional regulator [Kaistia soli]SHG01793.1 transcriptional regulator, LacI family [Kaistia soli DSM 19436]